MNLAQGALACVLALGAQLAPQAAEAPEFTGTTSGQAFYSVGEAGYSVRWTPSDKSGDMECQIYAQCGFADILGPGCPGQIFVALEFYDENGDYVNEGGDIFDSRNKRRFMAVEIGTNRDIRFDTFNVVNVFCGVGLPTGKSEL